MSGIRQRIADLLQAQSFASFWVGPVLALGHGDGVSNVEYVLAGGLMSIGPGHYEGYQGAAKYVDQILRGANPTELAIAGPTQFTVSVNRKALANLGLSLPIEYPGRKSTRKPTPE
jgi:hypothetical protein